MPKPSARTLRFAFAAPAANAAELTPVAQYVDHTVTEHEVGGALDSLRLEAE